MFTKILTSSLLFLIAIGGFFVSVDVGMQDSGQFAMELSFSETFANQTNSPESEALKKWIDIFNAVLWVLTIIVSPAVIFAGWLLSPDWTSGDIFWLREPMHKIWVVVSNIVYFVYAILLIIIAVATVLGKDNFNYKVMLPKLALGILMVPFTWWFVQWTISLATIVTTSTVSIPMDMITENNRYINGNYIPKYYLTTTDSDSKKTSTQYAQNCDGSTQWGWDAECTNIQEMMLDGGGIYSPLLVYAYQVFRLQDYKSIEWTLNQIKTAWQLLDNLIVWAVMFVVFWILVMALVAILFIRAVKLWMYAMFSPIFTLHFVAGKELFGKDTESFSLKEFVWLCFLPAIVGITLSFWLMVISIIQAPNQTSWQETCTQERFTINARSIEELKTTNGWCELIWRFGSFKRWIWTNWTEEWSVNIIDVAWVRYVYTWKATNASDMRQSINNITWWLSAAGGIFWTIIIDVIALIFIWMAFMAAKWLNTTLRNVVFTPLESIWQKAASMPKYIPLPIPGGSIAGAGKAVQGLGEIPRYNADKRYEQSEVGKWVKSQTWSVDAAKTIAVWEALRNGIEKLPEQLRWVTTDWFRSLLPEIKKNIDPLTDASKLSTAGYTTAEVKYITESAKKIKEGKELELDERLIFQARLSRLGDRNTEKMSRTDAENAIKNNSTTNSPKQDNPKDTNSSVKVNNNTIEIINDNINVTANWVNLGSSASEIANAIKKANNSSSFKTLVTKEKFIEQLNKWNIPLEKAKDIANELWDDFFKKETVEEPKK